MRNNNKQNNLLTKDYLDKKLKNFATKKDLKKFATKFATKNDLKKFATKKDLIKFATKEDLKKFATKEDLKNSIDRVMKYIDFKLAPIEEFRKRFEQFQNQVITTLDWIVRKLEKYDQEYIIMSNKYLETSDKIDNHEQRITVLEKKVMH